MKAGPTAADRNTIFTMYNQGHPVQIISSATKVRPEQIEIVISTIESGKFRGLKELQQPITAIAAANSRADDLQAQLDALKNQKTSGQKAAETRAANKLANDEAE
jgi:hypothetical protein